MDQRKTVLVAVGQDALALALWRGLHARRDDIEVHLARSPQALAMLLEHARPAIVVIEVEELGDSGLALLRSAVASPSTPRVVAISRVRSPRVDDILLAEGAEVVRHAPVDVTTLVDAIEAAFGAEETMTGRVAHVGVLDLVQMLCLARRSASVRFTAAEGRGGIWLEDGEITHAAWCELVGMDALVRLCVLDSGTFQCFVGGAVPRRTIADGWRQALMSAAYLADEQRKHAEDSSSSLPSAEIVPANGVAARNWQARYQELIEAGLAAMRGGDLAAARGHWNEAKLLQESHAEDAHHDVAVRPSRPTMRGFPVSA